MSKRYVLRYGDCFGEMKLWDQFQTVLEGTQGRRNLLIFRIITALISELDISDYDGYTMITVIEKWACERLSTDWSHPDIHAEHETESKSYTAASDHAPTSRSPDVPKETSDNVPKAPEDKNNISFDTSIFGGLNRNSKLSDI